MTDLLERLASVNPHVGDSTPPEFEAIAHRLGRRPRRAFAIRRRWITTTLAGLVLAGSATAAIGLSRGPREQTVKVVEFDVANAAKTRQLVGIPRLAPVDRSAPLFEPSGDLQLVPDRQRRLDPSHGLNDQRMQVIKAIERTPESWELAVTNPRETRVNYQADVRYLGEPYRVEVLQVANQNAHLGVEAPGEQHDVRGVRAYTALAEDGTSYATTFAVDGFFVAVSGAAAPAERLAVARQLGLIP